MLEKIKPNSPAAWRIYFIFLILMWLVVPILLFIACLPNAPAGLIAAMAYTGLVIAGGAYKFNKDMKAELSGVHPGFMGVIKLGGRIILILRSGSGLIFPVFGLLKLEIQSIRERNSPLKVEGIETADWNQIDWEKIGLNKEDYDGDPFSKPMIIDFEFNLFWYPMETTEGFMNYLTNVGDEEGLMKLAPDLAKSILEAEAGQRTVSILNFQREKVNNALKAKMQEEIDYSDKPERSWGIVIPRLRLSRMILPEPVVTAVTEVTLFDMKQYMRLKESKTESEIIQTIAKAHEFEQVYLGRGKAKAEMFMFRAKAVGERLITAAHGLGKAEGYGALAKALEMKEPDLLVKLDAMENTFKNIEKVWFPGSGALSDLFGFLPMLSDALKQAGIGGKK